VGSSCGFGLALLEQGIQVGTVVDDGSALPERWQPELPPGVERSAADAEVVDGFSVSETAFLSAMPA
jgi:hypothetical protein